MWPFTTASANTRPASSRLFSSLQKQHGKKRAYLLGDIPNLLMASMTDNITLRELSAEAVAMVVESLLKVHGSAEVLAFLKENPDYISNSITQVLRLGGSGPGAGSVAFASQ